MDLSCSKKSYSSDQEEDMNVAGSEESGSSHFEDDDSSDSEDSSANSTASSVTEYLRFSGPARPQNWALPDTIIFYISKNPSTPKLYQKLIRTCKYFFMINTIIICSNLALTCHKIVEDDENDENESKDEQKAFNDNDTDHGGVVKDTDYYWRITQDLINENGFYGEFNKDVDLKKYFAKFWIVGTFLEFFHEYTGIYVPFNVSNKNLVSSIIPKIYQCKVKELELRHQNISFTEFTFLSTSASKIVFEKVTVKYDDGTVVPVEKLVECATKATYFDFEPNVYDANISSEIVKNLIEIPHFSNLRTIFLYNIPDSFDIEAIFVYLKKHKSTSFYLKFSDSISAAYKKRLEAIIDEILEADGLDGYKSPVIDFSGLDEKKSDKMRLCWKKSL